MPKTSPVTSLFLILALLVSPLLRAQTVQPVQLRLRTLPGDNPANETDSLQSKKLTVEVTNEAGAPVPGVAVTFRLPENGPTGLFPDGSRSAVVYTTDQGQAAAPNIRWGSNPGVASIRITAVKGTAHAGILSEQELIARGTSANARSVADVTPPPVRSIVTSSSQSPAPASKTAANPPPAPSVPVTNQVTILTRPVQGTETPHATPSISPIPTEAEAKVESPPPVSISGAPPGHSSSGKTKWILLGLAAAGAAAGVAFAMGGSKSSSSATAAASGITIGAPSISIGHP
jgi:hypothetical protein